MTQAEARLAAARVAAFLKEHGASKVILFGSTVQGEFYPHHSDIDLYFEGIPVDRESQVLCDTFIAFPDLPLDLLPSARVAGHVREEALSTGVIL